MNKAPAAFVPKFMKRILSIGTAITVLGMIASTVLGQTQSTSTTTNTTYIEASKLIGVKVKGSQGDQVGEIKDIVLDENGCMAYTVLSTGGTGSRLTGSSKTVAVPWAVYSMTSDPKVVTVRVEKEKIYNAPVFDYARVREYSTGNYLNNVYSYYGVSGGTSVGVSAGVSNTATTNTNNAAATTTTTTAASPAATASATPIATPAATATATPTATASAIPSATLNPAASASPEASVAASASPSRHSKGTQDTSSASERHQSASENTGKGSGSSESSRAKRTAGESSSDEATPSTSGHKHHRSSEGAKSESSATPGEEKE